MMDIDYMRGAYHLALKARGKTSPNPLVGSLIVKGGGIIAEGWHRRCGADHAEIAALKKAGIRARGAKMYVTLEPCHHYGHTPPCVDKIINSGIKEVIIGMKDPNPLTKGKSIAKLRRAGIKTKVGVFQREVEEMNEPFVKYIKEEMPFVAAKCAQTLDGKIATAGGESKWITSEVARRFARNIRDEFDAILVGITTVQKDNPRLSASKKTKVLRKIILDSSLKISTEARLFSGTRPSDVFIVTTAEASDKKKAILLKKGVNVIVCPRRAGQIDLKWLFKELAKQKIMSILVEGGAHVIGSALKEKLVDKMYIYMAPKIFGDQKALSSVVGIDIKSVGKAVGLKKISIEKIGQDILIQGYVNY